MKITRNLAAIAAATSLFAAQSAQACWSDRETQAASVANLNMMMMVTALRCRKGAHNFLAEYNNFVKSNNVTLGAHNAVIKTRFAKLHGLQAAEGVMDRFTIGLANSYGGSGADRGCSELKSLAIDLASKSHDLTALAALADRHAGVPPLPGGQCGAKVAAR